MFDIQKIKEGKGLRRIEFIFLLWFLTIPFGSSSGSYSMGGLTIYPNLIISLILLPIAINTFFQWNKRLKTFSILLFSFIVYSLYWGWSNEYNLNWKIDLRSIIFQFIYAVIIFGMYSFLRQEVFIKVIKKGLFFFLVILFMSGVFEYYSGIHIAGETTSTLSKIETVSGIFYAPLFIYDNANTYLVYLLLIMFLYFGIQNYFRTKPWLVITAFLTSFIFSVAADSRISLFLSLLVIFAQLGFILFKSERKKVSENRVIAFVGGIMLILLFWTSSLFIGPKFIDQPWEEEFESFEKEISEIPKLSSVQVRKNLMVKAIEFSQEKPFLGIGPGQFRQRLLNNGKSIENSTVINPHNYFAEMISQYGLIGWLYFLILVVAFIVQLKNSVKLKGEYWILASFPVLALVSLMPSAFLCLDAQWLFIPVLLLLVYEKTDHTIANVGS